MSPQKQVVKKGRFSQTLTVMEVKPTLAQYCSNHNSTCSLHVIHPQRKRYFCFFIHRDSRSKTIRNKTNMYVNAICASENTGICRLLRRFSISSWRFQGLHRTMPGRAPFGTRTVALEIGRFGYWTKSSGVRPMCGNAGQACTVPGRCHLTLSDHTKRRMAAVEF